MKRNVSQLELLALQKTLDIGLISNYNGCIKNDRTLFTIGRLNYKANRFLVTELKKHNLG
jgi:calcineurin-like phosphoesterase family protein